MLCKQLLMCGKFKCCFLKFSGIFFPRVFLIYGWLNPWMWNLQIRMADCTYFPLQYSQYMEWWRAHSRSSINLKSERMPPVGTFNGDPRPSSLNLRSQRWPLTTVVNINWDGLYKKPWQWNMCPARGGYFKNVLILGQTVLHILTSLKSSSLQQ